MLSLEVGQARHQSSTIFDLLPTLEVLQMQSRKGEKSVSGLVQPLKNSIGRKTPRRRKGQWRH